MTIRKQLNFFISAMIILPVFIISAIHFYGMFYSPEKILMKGYYRLKGRDDFFLTETDWQLVEASIKELPRDTEAILVANGKVAISTFPELELETDLSEKQVWEYIKRTSGRYFYQFETPPLGLNDRQILIITRIDKAKKIHSKNILIACMMLISAFIIFCIIIVYKISKSIFKSLLNLKEKTEQIANGNLDAKIEISKNETNEITELCKSLESMRSSLVEAQNRRSRFVMGISHDLRTPIAVIKGYTEAMSDGMITSEKDTLEALNIITAKSSQLEQMIDTLISYEKLESKEITNKMVPTLFGPNFTNFAKASVATGTIFHKKVFYSVDIPEDLQINMDIQLAQRGLENLFSNALRYTRDNDSIYIIAKYLETKIVVSIRDTGLGMSEEDLKHIFDLFYRGTASRREAGMGIGLSVVKNIVEIHNWQIEVKSKLNEGTEFIITIPLPHLEEITEA